MKPDNIIFVKHGTKYTADHVNRLYEQLKEYFPEVQTTYVIQTTLLALISCVCLFLPNQL